MSRLFFFFQGEGNLVVGIIYCNLAFLRRMEEGRDEFLFLHIHTHYEYMGGGVG